jgi:hypothetical protein
MGWRMTAIMKLKAIKNLEIDNLKLTDEELAQVYKISSLTSEDKENLRETVFELSKLLYHINEPSNEYVRCKKKQRIK